MKKKNRRKITFEEYWNDYINEVVKRKFTYIVKRSEKEIIEFRRSLGIPDEGFRTHRAYGKWYREQKKKFDENPKMLYQQVGFVGMRTKEFEVPLLGKPEPRKKDLIVFPVGKHFDYFFGQRVAQLAYKIDLDFTWLPAFEEYVVSNNPDMRLLQSTGVELALIFYRFPSSEEISRKLCLIIGPNTRLKDIELMWDRQIKPVLETLPGYIEHPPRKSRKKEEKTS